MKPVAVPVSTIRIISVLIINNCAPPKQIEEDEKSAVNCKANPERHKLSLLRNYKCEVI